MKLLNNKPLFIFEMANNHMGDVKHGLRMIRDFAEIKNNSVEICQKYGIFNFPEIVLLKYDENI